MRSSRTARCSTGSGSRSCRSAGEPWCCMPCPAPHPRFDAGALLPRDGGRPGAGTLRRVGQSAGAVRRHLCLPRGGEGRAAAGRARDARAAAATLRHRRCRRTTCTGGRRSCSCRGRSWSAGLGGVSVPVGGRSHGGREDRRGARAGGAPSDRGDLGRLAADLSPPRHRHREADQPGARPRPASRARPDRAGRALQRRAVRPGRRPLDRGDPDAREPPGRRRRNRALHPRARGGTVPEPHLEPARRRAPRGLDARLEPLELVRWAGRLDPGFAGGGRQRAVRAIEIALLTGQSLSHWQREARAKATIDPWYVRADRASAGAAAADHPAGEEMVRRGLIEEVAAVLAEGHRADAPGLDGVGIREAVEYLTDSGRAKPWRRRSRSHPAVRQAAGDLVPASAPR